MKVLLGVDIATLVAITLGVGVLLTAVVKRSYTNPLLLVLAGLFVEILCAMVASSWLRDTEFEPYMRTLGRTFELGVVANLVWYLLPDGKGNGHRTTVPDK